MDVYEYKVVPAPAKGQKARGVRKSEDKFAYAIQQVMNQNAQDGWEFLRSETLPNEERVGLTNTSTTYRSMLVFRRPTESVAPEVSPAAKAIPTRVTAAEPPKQFPKPIPEDASEPVDNEVDFFNQTSNSAQPTNVSSLPAALRMRAERQQSSNDVAAE